MDKQMSRRRFLEITAGTGTVALVGGSLIDLYLQQTTPALAAPATRRIFDSAAASNWEDAFLSGNGRYGIMVFGNPLSETVIFNDHKFEQPNGSLGVQPPNLTGLVAQTRSDLLAGNYGKAANEFQNNWPYIWTQPFHPGYEMLLNINSSGTINNYSRVLNFETGEITVQWSDSLGNWTRQSFVSRADNVIVQQLTAPSNGTLNANIKLNAALSGAPSGLVTSNNVYTDSSGHTFLNMRVQYDSNPNDPGYEGVTWVVRTGGSQSINGTTLNISNATSVLLLTQLDRYAVATNWNNQALQHALVTLPTSYSTLLSRHVAIHQPIYDRVTIDLNGSASDRALATTDLINKQLSNPSQLNPALLEKLFDGGRYHFLSSSGYLPPRLTGLWLGSWGAAWSDDLTTDANLNLQMAGATIGNMPEAVQAYNNAMFNLAPQWVTNSTHFYGISNGIFGISRTDGVSGYEIHFDTANPFQMWTGGADWILYPIYEYALASGDTTFLQNSLWPWLEKLANFYVGFLTQKDSNGHSIFFPSYSPENAPGNTGIPTSINATQDVAAGKHALQTAIAVANQLGLQQGPGEEVATWSALLKLIPPYRVNSDGALAEWIWPSLTDNYAHRHVSHLYPVWPLHDITPDTTPSLSSAAEVALLKRSNPDGSAHGYLHRALSHARLKDGANVSAMLLQLLVNKYVFRSLMTSHYPNYNTYNADTAHTVPGILIEMLVDSQPGILEFLPALPNYLTQGTITGVVGRSQVTVVSLNWNLTSQAINATIVSAITQQITLISRRGIGSISSSAPLASSPLGSFARVISLQAGVNTTISISISGTPVTATAYAVNAGGAALGNFTADAYSSGGSTYSTSATIDTSAVSNPAPQAVYQTERYGNFTYAFPNLNPGTQYTVRLHEAETYWTSSGQRSFNVAINGQQVLSNFDLYAAAGGANKAIVQQYTATADASGQIAIQFTSVKDNAKVNGIEILPASNSTPTPTPTPTNTPTPTPTPTNTPTPTPTPTNTLTPTPTPTQTSTPTPTPTRGTGLACSVQYVVTNQWAGGFGTSITINNTGSTTINGWTLSWTFANGQTITQIWNATDTQMGGTVSVTNLSYNGTIAPGGNTNFGFNGAWSGSNSNPTAFTLNGIPCTVI